MLTTNARIVHAEQSIMRQFDSRPTVANTQVDTVRTPMLMNRLREALRSRPGSIIPAWKKLRERPGPSLGLRAGDFYTYVIDSFSPQSGNVFAGFSFSSEENDLIRDWSSCDSRIILADKMRLTYSKFPEEISPIAKIALEQLDRWHQSTTKDTSEESEYAKSEFSRVIPWELDFVERKTLIDWCRSYVSELLMDDNFTEQANPADAKKPRR